LCQEKSGNPDVMLFKNNFAEKIGFERTSLDTASVQFDQIGRNFAVWAHFSNFGCKLFFKKSPKIDLNKP
jgi:hypothetical protein